MKVSQLGKNIITSFVGQGILLVSSFISTHVIYHHLGRDVLGLLNFSLLITSFLVSFLDFGISVVATRELAAYRSTRPEYTESIIRSLSFISLLTFCLSSLVIALLSPLLLNGWVRLENISVVNSWVLVSFVCISVGLLLGILRTFYSIVLNGYERVDAVQWSQVSFVAIQQIGLITLPLIKSSLFVIAAWYLVSGLAGTALFGWRAFRVAGWPLFRPRASFFLRNNARYAVENLQVFQEHSFSSRTSGS